MGNHDRKGRYILEKSMNPAGWKFALFLLTLCASLTAAGKELGFSFSQGDWEVVCDNTRTCRMAGYSSEDADDGERGSVRITRAVGPDTPLEGEVTLADLNEDEEYKPPRVLTLWIDGQSQGKLNLRGKAHVYPLGEVANFDLTPLDTRHVLISALCWRGAYNWSYAHWVMDDALKGKPKFVTATANEYATGIISASFKGGGLGDCWVGEDWVWDGREFRQSAQWHTGQCRSIHLGGTWHLPTRVTKVIRENGLPRDPK
jgi:hypothetical protein